MIIYMHLGICFYSSELKLHVIQHYVYYNLCIACATILELLERQAKCFRPIAYYLQTLLNSHKKVSFIIRYRKCFTSQYFHQSSCLLDTPQGQMLPSVLAIAPPFGHYTFLPASWTGLLLKSCTRYSRLAQKSSQPTRHKFPKSPPSDCSA